MQVCAVEPEGSYPWLAVLPLGSRPASAAGPKGQFGATYLTCASAVLESYKAHPGKHSGSAHTQNDTGLAT